MGQGPRSKHFSQFVIFEELRCVKSKKVKKKTASTLSYFHLSDELYHDVIHPSLLLCRSAEHENERIQQ